MLQSAQEHSQHEDLSEAEGEMNQSAEAARLQVCVKMLLPVQTQVICVGKQASNPPHGTQ